MQKKLIKVERSVTFENIFSSIDEEPFWLCGQGWSTMSLRGFFIVIVCEARNIKTAAAFAN